MRRFSQALFVCAVFVAFMYVAAGCSADQLNRTRDAAERVGAATTQPLPTDMLPYGVSGKAIVGAVAGIIVGVTSLLIKRGVDASARALQQTVVGVENAFPQKTDTQKLILAAAQDDATKARVDAIKDGLPEK